MLFLVIEHFKHGESGKVGERFKQHGRMLPESVNYQSSWIDPVTARCFQIMEAPDLEALKPWIGFWSDLVDFEIVPVLTSGEYWANLESRMPGMDPIDVDEVAEVNFSDSSDQGEAQSVEVVFKNGTRKIYAGADLPEALAVLNHWTPPTA